jgi:inhibitor of KinA sporulation pathway (predicted exonuclease)
MGANLRTGIVVDIEATCWASREEQGTKPNEIIEIGVALLEYKTGAILERASIAVKPRFTEVSAFCTELTGWTQAVIDEEGLDIVEALAEFYHLFKPTPMDVWYSCGEYDKLKLSSGTNPGSLFTLYGIKADANPFELMRKHVNIKTLFAIKRKLTKEPGMARMMGMIGATLEGRHHNGSDDALNIAKIVTYVLK